MKYTAFNIGPIFKTILMARKPRELWSASFLFSYLMQCIIDAVPDKESIVSPGEIPNEKIGVGLCPDRIFIEGEVNTQSIIEKAQKIFMEGTLLDENTVKKYFKIMTTSLDASSVPEAIKSLNNILDRIELFETAIDESVFKEISKLVTPKKDSKYIKESPLYELAFNDGKIPIETLGEIAASSLKSCSGWDDFVKQIKSDDDKDAFNLLKTSLKSYHKYICVVQADGDNMGKIVSNSEKVKEISQCLIKFGKVATETIRNYGGMPIYAGGDDLLFISPVIGNKGQDIFDLIEELDNLYKEVQDKANSAELKTSMSYGISISYYKYPLYDSLSEARTLLFEKAKNTYKNKNAIAWNLHKHAGSSFYGVIEKESTLFNAFKEVIKASSESDSLTAAVSHKIRANEDLINLWIENKEHMKERNTAFFKKFIEYSEKDNKEDIYKASVLNLLNEICIEEQKKEELSKLEDLNWAKRTYGMIRTAKFINGEEVLE